MPHSANCQVWEILHPPLGAAVPRHSGHCKESTGQQHKISIRYSTCFTGNKTGEDTYSVLLSALNRVHKMFTIFTLCHILE